jgi:hypothetical protein
MISNRYVSTRALGKAAIGYETEVLDGAGAAWANGRLQCPHSDWWLEVVE